MVEVCMLSAQAPLGPIWSLKTFYIIFVISLIFCHKTYQNGVWGELYFICAPTYIYLFSIFVCLYYNGRERGEGILIHPSKLFNQTLQGIMALARSFWIGMSRHTISFDSWSLDYFIQTDNILNNTVACFWSSLST